MNGTLSTLMDAALIGGAVVTLNELYGLLCDEVARSKLEDDVNGELSSAMRDRVVDRIRSSKDASHLADMLDNLGQLLRSSTRAWKNAVWLKPLYIELGSIGKARIESSRKLLESVLLLVSTLPSLGFGLRPMLAADSDSLVVFFLRVCVEIKMLLEDRGKQEVLCQYFQFVELFVSLLVDDDAVSPLKATHQYACLDSLADCIRLLCRFLQEQFIKPDKDINALFIEALIRLCCCFMAEENSMVVADFQPLVTQILSKIEEKFISEIVLDFLEPAIESIADSFTEDESQEIQEFFNKRNRGHSLFADSTPVSI